LAIRPLIGIVGPCAAGKSTLVAGLKLRGYQARPIAQEHSYVQDMWKRITNPKILLFLSVSYPETIKRRNLSWSEAEYNEQLSRLQHARENADLIIETDDLTPSQVLERAMCYISGESG